MTGEQMMREQARAEGRAEGRAASLLLQIERKFGPATDDVRARVRGATNEEHERWLARILTAQSLGELFAPGKGGGDV